MPTAPVTSEDESELDRYENTDESENFGEQLRRNSKKRRKSQSDDFGKNEIIKESELSEKGHGVKGTVSKSNGEDKTKNPSPFYLKLTPLIVNLIRKQQNERQIDVFEATVDMTTAYADKVIDKMQANFDSMSKLQVPLNIFNTDNASNVKVPKTEVFDGKEYEKEKIKVMTTSLVNSWMHKYKDAFSIELSDVFSAFVLESAYNFSNSSKETKLRCEAYLEIFYEHINKKVNDITGIPEPLQKMLEAYSLMLNALNIGSRTITLSDKTKLVITTKDGIKKEREWKEDYKNDPFSKKKRGRRPRPVVTEGQEDV